VEAQRTRWAAAHRRWRGAVALAELVQADLALAELVLAELALAQLATAVRCRRL